MSWLDKIFKGSKRDPTVTQVPTDSIGTVPYKWWDVNFDDNSDEIAQAKATQRELYSMSLARMCINRIATEVSRANPELVKDDPRVRYICKYPNEYQTISQFLYQLATCLLVDANAYIIPLFDNYGVVNGLWIGSVHNTQIVEINDELWLQYRIGKTNPNRYVQYSECGHVRLNQYKSYLKGESNEPFKKIGALYDEHLKRSFGSLDNNKLKWIAQVNSNLLDKEDAREQQRIWHDLNFMDNSSNLLIYDTRFDRMEQLKKEYALLSHEDIDELAKIACSYWGVSESILQNRYSEAEYYAFYQSRIEPILDQIGEVMTKILYTRRQIMLGSEVTMRRLQFSSIKARLEAAYGSVDRGLITDNTALEILGLPLLPEDEGNVRHIRGEYYKTGKDGDRDEHRDEREEADSDGDSEDRSKHDDADRR